MRARSMPTLIAIMLLGTSPLRGLQNPDKLDACPTIVNRDSSAAADIYHPKHFVQLVEVTTTGDTILMPLDGESHRSKYQVDAGSEVQIRFNREWATTHPQFHAALRISATRNGTPIEVPNYTEVGEQERTSIAATRAGADVLAVICSLNRGAESANRVKTFIQAQRQKAQQLSSDNAQELARLQELRRQLVNRVASEEPVTQRLAGRLDSLEKTIAAAPSADEATALAERRAISTDSLMGIRRAISLRQDSIRVVDLQIRDLSAQKFVAQTSKPLLTRLEALRIPLSFIADTIENGAVLTMIARRTGRLPGSLVQIALNLRDRWPARLKELGDTAIPAQDAVIADISEGLEELEQVRQALFDVLKSDPSMLDRDLSSFLADTEINLPVVGAGEGDQLQINFANGEEGSPFHREMAVPIEVRRLGLIQRTSPSFMFFRRCRQVIHCDLNPDAQIANAKAVLASDTSRADTTLVVGLPMNYESAPGFTFGWTFHGRKGRSSPVLAWLEPGFGINVSFPTFQSHRVRISRVTGSKELTEETEAIHNNFDLGLGATISIFDNAIMATIGRSLTADSPKSYFGIGFGFIDLANKVKSAVSSAGNSRGSED